MTSGSVAPQLNSVMNGFIFVKSVPVAQPANPPSEVVEKYATIESLSFWYSHRPVTGLQYSFLPSPQAQTCSTVIFLWSTL